MRVKPILGIVFLIHSLKVNLIIVKLTVPHCLLEPLGPRVTPVVDPSESHCPTSDPN